MGSLGHSVGWKFTTTYLRYMALPTVTKTWTWISNQRSSLVSTVQSQKDTLFGFKTGFLAMSGASVKGSSVGSTSTMDGVDRWTSASAIGSFVFTRTSNNTSWIVITLANMGIEVLMAYVDPGGSGNGGLIMFSAGAGFTVSATSKCPSATDEANLGFQSATGFSITNVQTSWDRIWNFAYSSDGTACMMSTARAGVLNFIGFIQAAISTVVSPATFSPPVVGLSASVGGPISNALINFLAMNNSGGWNGNAKVFNGTTDATVPLFGGTETYGGSSSIISRMTFFPELQGGGFVFPELSIWSETGTSRGKLCNLIDIWAGPSNATDGMTYPYDNSRQFVQWGPLIVPWDGSIPVLA